MERIPFIIHSQERFSSGKAVSITPPAAEVTVEVAVEVVAAAAAEVAAAAVAAAGIAFSAMP